jgi:hypothetical protein
MDGFSRISSGRMTESNEILDIAEVNEVVWPGPIGCKREDTFVTI